MSLYNNFFFGEESLREGARSTRPPPSYLTLTLTLTLTCMKMYKSDDQISITLSLSLSKYLDLIFFFALPRFACTIVTFAVPRYACLLFSLAQPRYACVGLLCFLLSISSSFIAFYDSQKAAKSLQNQPKAAFLEKRVLLPSLVNMCFSPSFSVHVQNLDIFFYIHISIEDGLFGASSCLPRRSDRQAQ